MSPDESMAKFLSSLGCKRRGYKYILDGFGADFYLMFDSEPAEVARPVFVKEVNSAEVSA